MKVTCPTCRKSMVKRYNRRTGNSFYGCSNYPKCKSTRTARSASDQGYIDIGESMPGYESLEDWGNPK